MQLHNATVLLTGAHCGLSAEPGIYPQDVRA